jgi:L-threonine kinase
LKEVGFGASNGTFGELLQGMLPGERRPFLVTFPIDLLSTAVFRATTAADEVVVTPAHKFKSKLLATQLLRAYGYRGGGTLELKSALPEGKGLASSSADLVATARAVADALDITMNASEIEYFLRGIEPSDGVMHAGIVSYYHREARLRHRLGFLPPLTIVAHDTGGTVDTVEFNRSIPLPGAWTRREYLHLLNDLATAVRTGDLAAVGRISTRSAELHVRRFPRPGFEQLRAACRDFGGLGLVIAHSGTFLGILFRAHPDEPGLADRVRAHCSTLPGTISVFRSLGANDFAPTDNQAAITGGGHVH